MVYVRNGKELPQENRCCLMPSMWALWEMMPAFSGEYQRFLATLHLSVPCVSLTCAVSLLTFLGLVVWFLPDP